MLSGAKERQAQKIPTETEKKIQKDYKNIFARHMYCFILKEKCFLAL